MAFHKILLTGYDTFERHRLVAGLLDRNANSILDVGGHIGGLAAFTHLPITVVNITTGDAIGDGKMLPFDDDSIDIVTSLDVLEHLPKDDRPLLISEMNRVARQQFIFCTPIGSFSHIANEVFLSERLGEKGVSNAMLEEHTEFGLPTLEEVYKLLRNYGPSKAFFSGDFRFNSFLFRIDFIAGNRYKFIKVFLLGFLNFIGNIVVYPLTLKENPGDYTNRMTFLVEKR